MWYEVPKTPTHQKLAPIFPWEKYADAPTRAFPEDKPSTPEIEIDTETSGITPNEDDKPSPVTPTTPTISLTPADSWGAYTRGNAWDDIPEIERYIGNLQKNRKGKIQVLQGSESSRKPSIKLTDFPTELERPSLPVTPAPIRRPSFWGAEKDEEGEFPVADGVPSQEEWVYLSLLCREVSFLLFFLGSGREAGAVSSPSIRGLGKKTW
jgi:glycogenin glucosyltransferase